MTLVNFDLGAEGRFPTCRAADHIRLSRRIHAAVEPGQGRISARRGSALDLQIREVSAGAQWLEVAVQLGRGSQAQAWLDCSRFFCRVQLALQPFSTAAPAPEAMPEPIPAPIPGTGTEGVAAVETAPEQEGDGGAAGEQEAGRQAEAGRAEACLALRLHQAQGFEDIFAPRPLALPPELGWDQLEIAPPLAAQERAHGLDLHLFLPPGSGDLQIRDLAVTAVR